jgi:hypothetical protein
VRHGGRTKGNRGGGCEDSGESRVIVLSDAHHNILQLLQRIAILIREVPETKDTFRDSDGFLSLVHVLSTLSTTIGQAGSQQTRDVVACIKSAFTVASETLKGHEANLWFFEVRFFLPMLATPL